MMPMKNQLLNAVILLLICSTITHAQHIAVSNRELAPNIIMPQSSMVAYTINRPTHPVEITDIKATIDILDQVATTTLEIRLRNNSHRREQAELIMPVPDNAVIRAFTYQGAGPQGQAAILPKEQARKIYDSLVAKIRDPAILEFIGFNLVRSSVFPVEAHATQWVRLTYEHLLPIEDNRVDYRLCRSESLDYQVPWQLTFTLRTSHPIATVYSSSHKMEIIRDSSRNITVKISTHAARDPGPFHLAYLLENNGVTATMYSYPDPKTNGGYFLLLAACPDPKDFVDLPSKIKREVTLVIDRSGSMNGEKIEQARQAALQILAGLEENESFNIIVYSNTVESFSPEPVIKTPQTERAARQYIQAIRTIGGTNLYDALTQALQQKPTPGYLPIVLFLTDGRPTVGTTAEKTIRQTTAKNNPYQRRIFTFGVGTDVNAPLLENIADESRAAATFVLPGEDIEIKIGKVFSQLSGPVLADPHLKILTPCGSAAPGRIHDMIPNPLPDLFDGDQLILLGRYIGDEPITFELNGNYHGQFRHFKFDFDFTKATTKNSFVPRLWASRKIAELIDEIRRIGADTDITSDDPKVKELIDEVIRLSTEFGILTEYTAFLAREGTAITNTDAVFEEAATTLQYRAGQIRSGLGAVNQSINTIEEKKASRLNRRNEYYDAQMNRVAVSSVQQINDRVFYHRNNRWIDSRLVSKEDRIRPTRVIEFNSPEFYQLASRLSQQNRQGAISFKGTILMEVDGEIILIQNTNH